MHDQSIPSSSSSSAVADGSPAINATELVRRQARVLHRAAQSESVSAALPAVRRLYAAGIFPGQRLSALYRDRQRLQCKHFLRALAVEAGFPDWERFRPALDQMPLEAFDHFKVSADWHVFLNSWFSNEAQPRAYAAEHSGRVVRFGTQAVVVTHEHTDHAPLRPPPPPQTPQTAPASG